MARPLRIEYPGAFYHVMARGNEKQVIYKDSRDSDKFLKYLENATERYQAVIHCYCLMENHYHLLLETPAGNLSQIMRFINGAYSNYFNKRHERVGHVFQGRYKSLLVDTDAYCLTVSRYIHQNPVKEGIVEKPWDYDWSSCNFYVDDCYCPQWLRRDYLLSFFGGSKPAIQDYKKYLVLDDNHEELKMNQSSNPVIAGQRAFVEQVYDDYVRKIKVSRDLPDLIKVKEKSSINHIVEAVADEMNNDVRMTKKMSIYLCHRFSGHALNEIGENFGIGESAVSETSNRFAAVLHTDQRLAETVARLLSVLNL